MYPGFLSEEMYILRCAITRTQFDVRCLLLKRALRRYAEERYAKDYNPDQPRDDHGRWTSEGGSSQLGQGTQYADSRQVRTDAQIDDGNTNIFETWAKPETLADKFKLHGSDFGATSPEDYANQANQLYQRGLNEKLPTLETSEGYTKVWDMQTNIFGVYSPEGDTINFYKPTSSTYFQRQIQDVLARGGRLINPLPGGDTGPENPGGGGGRGGLGLFGRPDGLMHPTDEVEE